jgi:hypothetical protein
MQRAIRKALRNNLIIGVVGAGVALGSQKLKVLSSNPVAAS